MLLRNILRDFWIWLTGWPHLWSRTPHGRPGGSMDTIRYRPGWGPWTFMFLYATTYLAGTLCGYGIVSLSRAWYQRSLHPTGKYRLARFMTRLLDWLVPGKHGAHTGGWLWATASRRNMVY